MMVCLTASSYALYDFFVAVFPSVMTEQLMMSFNMSTTDLGWIGASFFYAYALMQFPSGWMLDRYGARRMLIFYSMLSAFGLLLFSQTLDFKVAMLARFISGTGVCIGFLTTYYLASRWLPHRYFSTVTACLHLLGTVGAIFAQGPLAVLVNQMGWRQVIVLLAQFTVVLTVVYALLIHDGGEEEKKPSVQFKEAIRYCLNHPQLRWLALVAFLSWLPVSTIGSLWGVPYLQQVFQWNNVTASYFCSFFWIGSGIGGFLLCGLSEWQGQRRYALRLGFVLAFVGAMIFVLMPSVSTSLLLMALFILGISVTIQTLTFSLIKENVPLEYFSAAAGLNNAFSMLSSALGQAFVGMLIDWHRLYRHQPLMHYTSSDYQFALLILPLASILGWAVVTYKIKETHCQSMEVVDESNYPSELEYQYD